MNKRLWALVWVVCCFFYSPSNAQLTSVPIPGTSLVVIVDPSGAPLQNLNTNPNASRVNVTGEDQAPTRVPLQHNFPYFGQNFNTSWMSENGVVTFKNPGNYSFCCNGLPIKSMNSSQFDYAIFPLWTDWSTQRGGSMFTLSNTNRTTYGWYGMNEYATNNRASFELTLNADGTFQTRMQGATVSMNPVTSGFTGDVRAGQKHQVFHKAFDGLQSRTETWSAVFPEDPIVMAYRLEEKKQSVTPTQTLSEVAAVGIQAPAFNFLDFDFLRRLNQANSSDENKKEDRKEKKEEKEQFTSDKDKEFANLAVQRAQLSMLMSNLTQYTKANLPDAPFYKDKGIYHNQRVVDNARAEKALQSSGTHLQMVDSQWDLTK